MCSSDLVESALSQSHRDLRVIVIDDASTDETPDVTRQLAARDPRVSIVRHTQNRGHIATYNEGIALADGDYLLVTGADDYLLPGAVERAVAILDREPEVGMVFGLAAIWVEGQPAPEIGQQPDAVNVLDSARFLHELALHNVVPQSGAIVRTSVQKRLDPFVAELPHAADLDMWVRYCIYSRVAMTQARSCVYRQHGANMHLGYSGWPDFDEQRRTFKLRSPEIRKHMRNGPMVENRIRELFALKTLKWAKRARSSGSQELAQRLTKEALDLVGDDGSWPGAEDNADRSRRHAG